MIDLRSEPAIPTVVVRASSVDRAQLIIRSLPDAVRGTSHAGSLVITDDVFTEERAVIVVEARPALCAVALERLNDDERILGVVTVEHATDLHDALRAIARGFVVASADVKVLAARSPRLTSRQLEVLRELLLARRNAAIAARLHVSETTVKRELHAIGKRFGATGRAEIAAVAHGLGFAAPPQP